MNEQNITQLRDLEPGDRFYAVSSSNKLPTFTVKTGCVFNPGHGSSTRLCTIDGSTAEVSKSCNLKVVKLCVSTNKQR